MKKWGTQKEEESSLIVQTLWLFQDLEFLAFVEFKHVISSRGGQRVLISNYEVTKFIILYLIIDDSQSIHHF